jgi:hypothetical protein
MSGANHLESLNASHLGGTPHFINITLTVAVPQNIPSLEESYKVTASSALNFTFLIVPKELRILPPSQLKNQLDKEAAASIYSMHHSLRCELATLQLRYCEFSNIARDVATRIQETQEQLANITHNIDQMYFDTLDALCLTDAPAMTMDSKCQTTHITHISTDSLFVAQDDI